MWLCEKVMHVSTYASAKVGTRYGPASLSDPDPLARRDTIDCCLIMLLVMFIGLLWGVEDFPLYLRPTSRKRWRRSRL
jgi:hypothetical protein